MKTITWKGLDIDLGQVITIYFDSFDAIKGQGICHIVLDNKGSKHIDCEATLKEWEEIRDAFASCGE